MNAQQVFLARLDALLTQCDAAKKAIKSKGIDDRLFKRAAQGLLLALENLRNKIENLRTNVAKKEGVALSWGALQGYEGECLHLFREGLAFLQAARARGHDVEADLCEIADALLDELVAMLDG